MTIKSQILTTIQTKNNASMGGLLLTFPELKREQIQRAMRSLVEEYAWIRKTATGWRIKGRTTPAKKTA